MSDAGGPDRGREMNLALRALMQAGQALQTALARRVGVGVTDLLALDHLVSADPPLGPVELGNRLGIRSASATVLVDRLEAAGHLRRAAHPADRRRITLQATEHARTEVREALAPLLATVDEITAGLDDAEFAAVRDFLGAVTVAMREFGAGDRTLKSTSDDRESNPED